MSQSLIYWHWPFCCMLKKVWGLCLVRAYLHRKRVRREMLGSKWPLGPILNQWLMGGSWCIGILPQLGIQPSLSFQMSQQFSSVQLLSCAQLFVTLWTAAHQASLSITNSLSLLKLISIKSMMSSNHLILCLPLLLLPSIFSSIRVFSNESALRIRWPKYWSFSFNISPSNEYSGLNIQDIPMNIL